MSQRTQEALAELLSSLSEADDSVETRVSVYNAVSAAIGGLVREFAPDPALSPQLVPVGHVEANAYNPNHVATPELELLEESMREDGITMCVVTMKDGERHEVVDGFHRRTVAADRLQRRYLPCSVIDKPLVNRMASTVRHNRARGKHQVDLMADLVKAMASLGWDEKQVADAMGMTGEELLRLRQITGAAKALAADEYTREWKVQR